MKDATKSRRQHCGQDSLRQNQGTAQVDRHNPVKVRKVDKVPGHIGRAGDPDGVDHGVKRPARANRGSQPRADLARICQIKRHCSGLSAGAQDVLRYRSDAITIPVDQNYCRAAPGKMQCRGLPDAAGSPGHQHSVGTILREHTTKVTNVPAQHRLKPSHSGGLGLQEDKREWQRFGMRGARKEVGQICPQPQRQQIFAIKKEVIHRLHQKR